MRELLGGWREEAKKGERATRGMEGREVRGVRELLGGWRGEWRTR